MSKSLYISIRYAKVLFELAQESGKSKEVLIELLKLKENVATSAVTKQLLNAGYPKCLKSKIWDKFTAKMKLSKLVANFIAVLIEHNRVASFFEIIDLFEKMQLESEGCFQAKLYTSTKLNNSEEAKVQQQAEKLFSHKLQVQQIVDESLLAGVVMRVGSMMLDASLAGQLKKLKLSMQISK